MLRPGTEAILSTYAAKAPAVVSMEGSLRTCVELMTGCFQNGGQLLICGNGGSCADADHIVGELVKSFRIRRPLDAELSVALQEQGDDGKKLADCLQSGLPAINLAAHASLMTAMQNDVGGQYSFAQQVVAYGRRDDILLGISTSGNSQNVLFAGAAAKAKGLRTIALTGREGGIMRQTFDLALCANADSTEDIQDLHSTIYHAICAAVEYQFWGD